MPLLELKIELRSARPNPEVGQTKIARDYRIPLASHKDVTAQEQPQTGIKNPAAAVKLDGAK